MNCKRLCFETGYEGDVKRPKMKFWVASVFFSVALFVECTLMGANLC